MSKFTKVEKKSHPEIGGNYFKQVYFEAIDTVLNSMKDRFS